ncbi:hypothetical protein QOZ80_2BG0180820 [Eleusine coracana subsp. coracana]|nr:hypothetical protein QOZ80_2BG0180820 [Eleusine coracana subsp. coracana]
MLPVIDQQHWEAMEKENGEAAEARVSSPRDGKKTLPLPEEPPRVPLIGVLYPRTSDADDGDEVVLSDEDVDLTDEDDEDLYYDADDSDSDSDADDSDAEFDDDDEPLLDQFDGGKAAGTSLAPVEFLGEPARFATVDSTAGFMVLRDGGGGDAAGQVQVQHDASEITVHYRYDRFTRDPNGGPGVEEYSGAKIHPLRFLLPDDDDHVIDPASTLRLAGAAMADIMYPPRFAAQLKALWSSLVAAEPVQRILSPATTRVEVIVNVGILRRGDRTPERRAFMREALVAMAMAEREACGDAASSWPFIRHVGVVMHLPAPVSCVEDGSGARPAKRRKFSDDACAICFEVMERELAAWPRCDHVFHDDCLEQLLLRGDHRCPPCRSELNGKAPKP